LLCWRDFWCAYRGSEEELELYLQPSAFAVSTQCNWRTITMSRTASALRTWRGYHAQANCKAEIAYPASFSSHSATRIYVIKNRNLHSDHCTNLHPSAPTNAAVPPAQTVIGRTKNSIPGKVKRMSSPSSTLRKKPVVYGRGGRGRHGRTKYLALASSVTSGGSPR
jgi:hypothetical protein